MFETTVVTRRPRALLSSSKRLPWEECGGSEVEKPAMVFLTGLAWVLRVVASKSTDWLRCWHGKVGL